MLVYCNCNMSGKSIAEIKDVVELTFEVTDSYALFLYLTTSFEEAVSLYKDVLSKLRSLFNLPLTREDSFNPLKREPLHLYEKLTCSLVKMAAWHMRHSGSEPLKTFRDLLWQSIQQFPDNVFLARLFVKSEFSSTVASFQLQRRLNSLLKLSLSPLLLFVTFNECHPKFQETQSGMWLQSLLQKGTERWKHSILLWRHLFQIHLITGKVQSKSIEVNEEIDKDDPVIYLQHQVPPGAAHCFYESLRFCPWAKQLYLDKIKHDSKQWEHVLDMMTEKEIRVRFPIEELKILLENR
jgi:hypothetical protein